MNPEYEKQLLTDLRKLLTSDLSEEMRSTLCSQYPIFSALTKSQLTMLSLMDQHTGSLTISFGSTMETPSEQKADKQSPQCSVAEQPHTKSSDISTEESSQVDESPQKENSKQ